MSSSCKCTGVNGEALKFTKPFVCTKQALIEYSLLFLKAEQLWFQALVNYLMPYLDTDSALFLSIITGLDYWNERSTGMNGVLV